MLTRRSLIASTAALAAGCSALESPLSAPTVGQEVELNVAASSLFGLFRDPFSDEKNEDKFRRAVQMLGADSENRFGPSRGGYRLALRFFERLYPLYEPPETQEEAEAARKASLEAAAALLEYLEADLVMVHSTDAGWFAEHGIILPLDRFTGPAGSGLEGEFFPSVLDYFRRDGALHALPVGALPVTLHYDEGLFALRGVPPVDTSWDWDDLVDAAFKLTTHKEDGTVARWGLIAHREWLWWALWQNGAEAIDPDTLQCRLQEPAALEALQFAHDLIHKYRVSPLAHWLDLWEYLWPTPPAMHYDHVPLPPAGFRMAALPRSKVHAVPVRADFGLAIAARTKEPEAAYTALRGLTHAMQTEVAVPAIREAVARLADIRTDLRPEEVAAIQHSMEHGRAEPRPVVDAAQLFAMNGVMWELGHGADVAAMVNAGCARLREYQQLYTRA